MRRVRTVGQRAFAALLCLSLVTWSVMPAATDASVPLDTLQDHLDHIAEHGHTHGFAEDLLWALHGHGHGVADYDHGQAMPALAELTELAAIDRDTCRHRPHSCGPPLHFRIERPPRV
ncbi:hypothetical protein [Bauldia sp.]|uniref:hypothetical protein n=1 Tax=Bauldia sp. TaxID=2575872 RepID=UPI003BAA812A